MTDLAKVAQRFVEGSQNGWASLVDLVVGLEPKKTDKGARRLAQLSGTSPKTMLQKFLAIRDALDQGVTVGDIKAWGQHKIIGQYVKHKNGARQDKQVLLCWKVAPEIRDAAKENVWRIAQVLGFRTSNELWTYLNSQMEQWSEQELKHSAGEPCSSKPSNESAAGR